MWWTRSCIIGDYFFYLGDDNGKVNLYSSTYVADESTAIAAQWVSKRLDFLDLYPDLVDRWKTIHAVKLVYVDKGSIDVIVSISTDGCVTWTNETLTVGSGASGTDTIKTATYDFIVTGQYFNIKVAYLATTKTFQWVELWIDMDDAGEHIYLA